MFDTSLEARRQERVKGRRLATVAMGLFGVALLASVAGAHQDPPACEGVNIG